MFGEYAALIFPVFEINRLSFKCLTHHDQSYLVNCVDLMYVIL